MKKAIFLDRDGVINVDKGYVYKKEDFEFFPDVMETLKYFTEKNFLIFIVTNQSGIERGYFTLEDFQKLNSYMLSEFEKNGVMISKVYFCPHSPEAKCKCRKPNPKMLLDAKVEFDVDLQNSWMIGDKKSDMEAGFNAGVKNLILVDKKSHKSIEKYNVKSLSDTIKVIF